MSLNTSEIDKLLQTEIVYFATADVQGKPHVKPIWFVYHSGKIWFETDKTTRAFRNIKTNNNIMLCFGGRETYLVWGTVAWYEEQAAPVQYRKMLWEKYGKDMDDSFITANTYIFEVIVAKELSWHYADQNWE